MVSLIIIISASTITAQDFVDAFQIGASQHDEAYGSFEDSHGNIYLSGNFEQTVDFDPGSGEAFLSAVQSYDGYLAKYDADMNYIWAISIGGTDQVNGKKVVVDGDGNSYMAGYFKGEADFDPSGNEYLIESEDMDGFLAKYDADGNFVWAFRIGSPESDIAFDVCLDPDGNIWVSGTFNAPVDFDPSAGTFILNDHGFQDAYVAKYSTDGSFIWAGGIGGETSMFYQPAMDIDNTGNLYLSCQFSGQADLDPGIGTYMVESAGSSDMYLLSIDNEGIFNWGFAMGGAGQDQTRDVYYSDGLVLITGFIESTVDFDPSSGEAIVELISEADGFIAAYGTDGTYTWVKAFGGTHNTYGAALADDDDNNIYLTGTFYGTTDFDPSSATFELTALGDWDIFTAKYDVDGNFKWAINAGGYDSDYSQHIIISSDQESVFVCGKFKGGGEFDHLGAGHILNANGGFDAFLAAYSTYGGAGINEINNVSSLLKVFPNPARDEINIGLEEYTIDEVIIYDMAGHDIYHDMINSGVIDISVLSPGMYLIVAISGSKRFEQKLVIE